MARRKRASMREGPLADLFRSTADDAAEEQPPAGGRGGERGEDRPTTEEPAAPEPVAEEPAADEPVAEEPLADEPLTDEPDFAEEPFAVRRRPEPAPEPVAYEEREREVEPEPEPYVPQEPRDTARLSKIFSEGGTDVAGPAYGRDEPDLDPLYGRGEGEMPAPGNPVIRVIGVGGAGVNAVNRMVESGIHGVEFVAVNTDLQSLSASNADVTVHIGGGVTRGLGSGSDPELGYKAAFAEQDKIKRLLKGSDMVFVTAGAGGGTGTGAAPVIARLARDVGALTVGIVTRPFKFEGSRRATQADEGIDSLAAEVDTLITVPNERLLSVLAKQTSIVDAFKVADDVLRQGVQGISELITLPGLINLDFADVRTTMRDAGQALLGIGMGAGDGRAVSAAERAVSSPLLETSVDGARSILLSLTGGADMTLLEVSEAAKIVQEAAHPDANIIFGANVDESLTDQVWITVIATRFDGRGRRADGSKGEAKPRAAGTTATSTRRPEDRRPGSAPSFETRPRDFGLDVPEFMPN